MAFFTATGHECMGYCPSFTCVSNHSPSTYMFHMLSKMKPVAKIKYLIAVSLSKYTSQLLGAVWQWKCKGVSQARDDQPGRVRLGFVPGWPAVCHTTNSTDFRLPSHTEVKPQGLVLRLVPMETWAGWALKDTQYRGKKVQITTSQLMKEVPPRSSFKSQVSWTACCLFLCWLQRQHEMI